MNRFLKSVVLVGCISVLSACSHSNSVGEQMVQHGKSATALGKEWKEGNNLIHKGNKLVKTGHKNVSKGNSQISEGKAMIAKGNRMINKSEKNFHEEFPAAALEE